MSPRERDRLIRLDEILTEDQIEIMSDAVVGELIGRSGDLRLLNSRSDPKAELKEVSALGRLAAGLKTRRICVPDRAVLAAAVRLAKGIDAINEWEEIVEQYEAAMAEHAAARALVAALSVAGEAEGEAISTEGRIG